MAGRGMTERFEVVRGLILTAGQPNILGANISWPLGELWHALEMRVNIPNTIGTGVARTEGLLRFIQGFNLKGGVRAVPGQSVGGTEIYCNNIPARFLWRLAQIKNHTTLAGPVTATGGTDRVSLIVPFTDSLALAPNDFTLRTSRLESVDAIITLGAIGDIFSTVGTATLGAVTMDMYLIRQRGDIPTPQAFYKQYGFFGAVDPTATQKVQLERRASIIYQRLGIFTGTGGGVTGPFLGDASDAVINDFDVEQTAGGPWAIPKPYQNVLWDQQQRDNKWEYELEAVVAGWNWINFPMADGSIESSNPSFDKALLDYVWRNGTLPATPSVTVGFEGIRPVGA